MFIVNTVSLSAAIRKAAAVSFPMDSMVCANSWLIGF